MEFLGAMFLVLIVCAGLFFLMGVATMGSASEAWRIIQQDFFERKKCKKCGCKK